MSQMLKHRQKLKCWIKVAAITLILLVVLITSYTLFIQPPLKYKSGQETLNSGDYIKAVDAFMMSYDYKDSMANIQSINRYLQVISTTNQVALAIKSDNTIVVTGNTAKGQYDVSGWDGIISVCASEGFVLGLKKDGTVVATKSTIPDTFVDYGQLNVKDWKNVVQISASSEHTIALISDGTVISIGNNDFGQCDTDGWENIVALSAGYSSTVGLKQDGSVVAIGDISPESLRTIKKWKNIVAISASDHIIGLKSSGNVVATGDNSFNQCRVWFWKDIVAIEAGSGQTIGLKANGTILYRGRDQAHRDPTIRVKDMNGKSTWKDIIAISSKVGYVVGLKSDGTVVTDWGNSNASTIGNWVNISPISSTGDGRLLQGNTG